MNIVSPFEAKRKLLEALNKIVPWFFALDHTNRARWMPIHLHDLVSLKVCHPTIHAEFVKGILP